MTERVWIRRHLTRLVRGFLASVGAIYDVADPSGLDPEQARDIAAALRDCVTDINAEIARYDQRAGEN